jgi:hypothetical protein
LCVLLFGGCFSLLPEVEIDPLWLCCVDRDKSHSILYPTRLLLITTDV